jgi:hypothetical protein
MKANVKENKEEKLKNTVAKDSKKYQDDIIKYEEELHQIENKLMVNNI